MQWLLLLGAQDLCVWCLHDYSHHGRYRRSLIRPSLESASLLCVLAVLILCHVISSVVHLSSESPALVFCCQSVACAIMFLASLATSVYQCVTVHVDRLRVSLTYRIVFHHM